MEGGSRVVQAVIPLPPCDHRQKTARMPLMWKEAMGHGSVPDVLVVTTASNPGCPPWRPSCDLP